MELSPVQDGTLQKTNECNAQKNEYKKIETWYDFVKKSTEEKGILFRIEIENLGMLLRLIKKTGNNDVKILTIARYIDFLTFAMAELDGIKDITEKAIREIELAYSVASQKQEEWNGRSNKR